MDTKTETYNVGNTEVMLICDFYFGEYLDTKVVINGQTICTIEGSKRLAFIEDLNRVVNKYQI